MIHGLGISDAISRWIEGGRERERGGDKNRDGHFNKFDTENLLSIIFYNFEKKI